MLPDLKEERKAGNPYLVLAFVLASSTRRLDLSFWFSCYKVIQHKKLDIPPNVFGICWRETTFFSETFRFNFVVLADCKGSLSPSHCL